MFSRCSSRGEAAGQVARGWPVTSEVARELLARSTIQTLLGKLPDIYVVTPTPVTLQGKECEEEDDKMIDSTPPREMGEEKEKGGGQGGAGEPGRVARRQA
eukprot:scaffold33819_cov23-Tisochrysis_lutea.AAC.3